MAQNLYTQLNVRCNPVADVSVVARAWVEASYAALPPALWEASLRGRISVPPGRADQAGVVVGDPEMWYSTIHANGRRPRKRRTTLKALNDTTAALGSTFNEVFVLVEQLDEAGSWSLRPSFCFGAHVAWYPVVSLYAWPTGALPAEHWYEQWLLDSAKAFAVAMDVEFGMISVHCGQTGMEVGQRHLPHLAVEHERHVLRGYEWVTVISPQIAQGLGGADRLASSDAFWQVEEIAGGAVWLQATEHFDQYGPRAVQNVFEALRPVLPDRRLVPPPAHIPSFWTRYDQTGLLPDPSQG